MFPDVFPGSTLDMSTTAAAAEVTLAPAWSDALLTRVLVCVSAVLVLLLLRTLISLAPALADCVSRWRGNESIEHSLSQRRLRNLAASSMFLPFCLVLDCLGLTATRFGASLPRETAVLAGIALPAAYLLLRWIVSRLIRPSAIPDESFQAARHVIFNMLIVFTAAMLLSVSVLYVCGVQAYAIRTVVLVETALMAGLSLLREYQIFNAYCGGFSTFLYLCGLEFLPAGCLMFCVLAL